MKKLKKLSVIFAQVFGILGAVCVAGSYAGSIYGSFINRELQVETTKIVTNEDSKPLELYKSTYSSQDELFGAKMQLNREVAQEGAVMLKNENSALPINNVKKITVFGRSSVDIIRGIEGGASQIDGVNDSIPTVFKSFGIEVNPTLYSFYEGKTNYNYSFGSNQLTIGEVPTSEYTSEVRNSYSGYSDASIVILSRSRTEGADYQGTTGEVSDGDGIHVGLGIQKNERDMIEEAKSCSNRVIVLLATDYAMEIDDLKNDSDIDAIVWVGGTGLNGIYGSIDVITGKVAPSGHLSDAYASSVLSSPAACDWQGSEFTNVTEDLQKCFTVYQEGIYVGYKYYETRYEDCVLNRYNAKTATGTFASEDNWSYSKEVSYSFGYGLSYTTFEEDITSFEVKGNKAYLDVKVTNAGSVSGKHVIQVYAQSPYTSYDVENKVEKASVQLVGFEKTQTLEPKQSVTKKVEIELKNLASYDYTKAKTYIFEDGDYYFALGNGAHDALNNILAKKGYSKNDGMDYEGNSSLVSVYHQGTFDSKTFATNDVTGVAITNQLDNADINYYGNYVTYLSRSDWKNTWPKDNLDMEATEQMIKDLQNGASYTKVEATDEDKANMIHSSTATNYSLIMLRDEDFDSKYWEDLLNQLTPYEMTHMIGASGSGSIKVDSVMFAGSMQCDGPAGPKANYTEGKHTKESSVTYPTEVLLASTFNKEMADKVGAMMGNDCLVLKANAMYAPGINIHRTPMSGRNAEYYSEDSVLSSEMGYHQVTAAQEFGLILGPKHFAFNDQEVHRQGIGTFFNEQGAREIMLRAFEKPMENSLGCMSAYNRVGCTYSSAHKGLTKKILRTEWGFKGYLISDAVGSRQLARYADAHAAVTAGLSVYCVTVETLFCGSNGALSEAEIMTDPNYFKAVKEACHYNLYAWVHSSAVNGYSSNMKIETITPWWKTALIVVDSVVGACLLGSVGLYVYTYLKSRKEKQNEGND